MVYGSHVAKNVADQRSVDTANARMSVESAMVRFSANTVRTRGAAQNVVGLKCAIT